MLVLGALGPIGVTGNVEGARAPVKISRKIALHPVAIQVFKLASVLLRIEPMNAAASQKITVQTTTVARTNIQPLNTR